jgi:hypothetical protein
MKFSINIPAPAPRSGLVVAMNKRHGGKGGRMKDRRQGRAGAKNRMREYLADA